MALPFLPYREPEIISSCPKLGKVLAHPRKSLNQLKGILRVWRKIPTLIAVPTTAGTGSEVTLASIITDSEKKCNKRTKCKNGNSRQITEYKERGYSNYGKAC